MRRERIHQERGGGHLHRARRAARRQQPGDPLRRRRVGGEGPQLLRETEAKEVQRPVTQGC